MLPKIALTTCMVTLGIVGLMTTYGARTDSSSGNVSDRGEIMVQEVGNTATVHDSSGIVSKSHHGRHRHGDLIRDTATILNIKPSELRNELRSGKSIVEVAASKGISEQTLTSKLRANLERHLKQAEEKGRLTTGKRNRILAMFDRHITKKLNRKSHVGRPLP